MMMIKEELLKLLIEPCLKKIAYDITAQTTCLLPNCSYEQLTTFEKVFIDSLKEDYLRCTDDVYNLSIYSLNKIPCKILANALEKANITFENVDYIPFYISIFIKNFSCFLEFRVDKALKDSHLELYQNLKGLLIESAIKDIADLAIKDMVESRELTISPATFKRRYNTIFSSWKRIVLVMCTSKEFGHFRLCKYS